MKRALCLVLSLALLLPAFAIAQDDLDHRRVGLSVAVQDVEAGIRTPIWLNPDFVLTPSVGVVYSSDIATDLSLGLGLRRNLRSGRHVPYVGVQALMLRLSPEGGDSITDLGFGLRVGGESFLTPGFSLGVEAQLNAAISDESSGRFGNPDGTNLNTATVMYASFYF